MYWLFFLFLFFSCQAPPTKVSLPNISTDPLSFSELNLVFSHNINGETNPCGCQHFPLGGLPQVAGALNKLEKKAPTLYFDIGDTFFNTGLVTTQQEKVSRLTANVIAQGLEKIRLQYLVPGDQDFALGADFLQELALKNHFTFLISNTTKLCQLPVKPWVHLKVGAKNIYLVAVVHPSLYASPFDTWFSDPLSALTPIIDQLKKNGYRPENPSDLLIVLSHSGMAYDLQYAQKFPTINWILGSHTQDFLRNPVVEGNTKIVQVKYRNHYLGHLNISSNNEDRYALIEVSDGLKNELSPNPLIPLLEEYKINLEKLQKEDEEKFTAPSTTSQKIPTYHQCLTCHQEQRDHWEKTPHALAYITLIQNKVTHNPACVGCHTLGYQNPQAFNSHDNVAVNGSLTYWKEVMALFQGVSSIRKLPITKTQMLVKKWLNLDQKYSITHNYANVQCLNCHDQSSNHPFDIGAHPHTVTAKKCLECHTSDQSAHWYQNGKLNEKVFKPLYKKISCPKGKAL